MSFKVTKIIDGSTIEVIPNWTWGTESGNIIRIHGFTEQESDVQLITDKLYKLLFDKEVELNNPIRTSDGKLLCEVLISGKNVADFFPEDKTPVS